MPKPTYWIFKHTVFCPLCGRSERFHERRQDAKPAESEKREAAQALPCWLFDITCSDVDAATAGILATHYGPL